MKQCGRCKEHKPLDGFNNDKSRPDGKYPTCKACKRTYVKSARGQAARERWVAGGGLERAKEYAKTDQAKDKRNARLKNVRREAYKIKARTQTTLAIKSGRLPVANAWTCLGCREQATEYHHHDYQRPLDVTPLCRDCHVKLHAYMRHHKLSLGV